MRCLSSKKERRYVPMAIRRRSFVAIGVLVLLGAVAALGRWYEMQRAGPQRSATQKVVVVHVTNPGDRGPGTLREALFIVAGATDSTSIQIEIPKIDLETALPAVVNGNGVKLTAQAAGTQIDAHLLTSGPVLDISGPNTSIEGITITNCPAEAILVRAARFRLSLSNVVSCDVGVEVAENASDTFLERSHFVKDRVGVRFGASGRNSAVASNEFTENKDASIWARS